MILNQWVVKIYDEQIDMEAQGMENSKSGTNKRRQQWK